MREIKFRGITNEFSSPRWVYGDLIYDCTDEPRIMTDYHDCYEPTTWPVDPATVGQFTGLKDADGCEIYEDDIVRVVHYGDESIHVIKYCDDMDYPAFDLLPNFDCECNGLSFCKCENETTITVIGNVHDNPDLLEVAHD